MRILLDILRSVKEQYEKLQVWYDAPHCGLKRAWIEYIEEMIELPVTSCFYNNYRVGFGNFQDHLARDPDLLERAERVEREDSERMAEEWHPWEVLHPPQTYHQPRGHWRADGILDDPRPNHLTTLERRGIVVPSGPRGPGCRHFGSSRGGNLGYGISRRWR
jgi:hypothetical protein